MLSDVEILAEMSKGTIRIVPFPEDRDIQPASVDVHVGNRWGFLEPPVSMTVPLLTDPSIVFFYDLEAIVLAPGRFCLAQLQERLTIDASLVARIEGKSSNGRRGLAIHVTAGFVDPGWDGILTLELFNMSNVPYVIRAGDPIGQLAFDRVGVPSHRPYGHERLGSHYQGSDSVGGGQ